MNNTLKKITPFLIVGIYSIVIAIYKLITDSHGLEIIVVFLFFIIGVIILLIDFGFKKWLKTFKKIAITELIFIGIMIIANQYQYHRIKTLEIPNDMKNQYVTIIYAVDGQSDLGVTNFTWSKNIKIPDNGILTTSSEFDIDLPKTKIKTSNNEYFKTKESDMTFGQFGGSLSLNNKVYRYRSWQIGKKENCCSHTGEEMRIYEKKLKKELERIKASR